MKLPRTIPRLVLEILCLAVLLLQLLLPLLLWSRLPDPMPTHFNMAGEADGWGSRWTVFMFPGFSLFLWLLMSAVTRLNPKYWNMPFSVPYGRELPVYSAVKTLLVALKLEVIALFAAMELLILFGGARFFNAVCWPAIGLVFVTLAVGLYIAWRKRFW